jgi:hypothetical protein
MNSNKMIRAVVVAAGLLGVGGSGTASAQIVIYPPAAYIATAQPIYFEGRPAYWYNNHWYYRDRGSWGYYHDEPPGLREHREHGYGRYHYEGHGGRGWRR